MGFRLAWLPPDCWAGLFSAFQASSKLKSRFFLLPPPGDFTSVVPWPLTGCLGMVLGVPNRSAALLLSFGATGFGASYFFLSFTLSPNMLNMAAFLLLFGALVWDWGWDDFWLFWPPWLLWLVDVEDTDSGLLGAFVGLDSILLAVLTVSFVALYDSPPFPPWFLGLLFPPLFPPRLSVLFLNASWALDS